MTDTTTPTPPASPATDDVKKRRRERVDQLLARPAVTSEGQVTLAGKVNRLLASLTGASKLKAADLPADDVELSVTGAGKADVTASNLLRASITGAGKVSYGGQPKSVEKKITGAGKIEPRE